MQEIYGDQHQPEDQERMRSSKQNFEIMRQIWHSGEERKGGQRILRPLHSSKETTARLLGSTQAKAAHWGMAS